MNIPIDREKWSESSKRSYAFHYLKTHYEDIQYRCRKCNELAIFTAGEQKIAFEVKKNYIWQQHVLCTKCNDEFYKLKIREKEFQHSWSKYRSTLKNDQQFLSDWLNILNTLPAYGKRPRSSMIKLLNKLLDICI